MTVSRELAEDLERRARERIIIWAFTGTMALCALAVGYGAGYIKGKQAADKWYGAAGWHYVRKPLPRVPPADQCGFYDKDAPGGLSWGPCPGAVPLSSLTDDEKLLHDGDVVGTDGREFIYDKARNKWVPLTGDVVRNDVCGACNTTGKCWEVPCSQTGQ